MGDGIQTRDTFWRWTLLFNLCWIVNCLVTIWIPTIQDLFWSFIYGWTLWKCTITNLLLLYFEPISETFYCPRKHILWRQMMAITKYCHCHFILWSFQFVLLHGHLDLFFSFYTCSIFMRKIMCVCCVVLLILNVGGFSRIIIFFFQI